MSMCSSFQFQMSKKESVIFFGSGFGEPGDTLPPRIPRSIPPLPRAALKQTIIVGGRNDCLVCQVDTSDIRGSTTRFQPTYRKPHVYEKITLFVFVLNCFGKN